MGVIKAIFIAALVYSVSAEESLLKPCEIKDMECLSETTQNFLEHTSAGIPTYNIKPIDPLVIPDFDYDIPELDMVYHFKNLTVVGLKNQKISDFKLDKATKSVVLQTRVDDAKIYSDFTIEFKGPSKFLTGTYFAKTTVIGTAKYNYDLIPNKEGVEYFEIGPETITCEALGVPEVTLDPKLTETVANDPDAIAKKEEYAKRTTEIRQKIMTEIFKRAYVTVIHNIRASSKVFPKTAFFKDI